MRLQEVLEKIEENKNFVATYDELLHTLDKALVGTLPIPVDTVREVVPAEVIRQVRDQVQELRDEHVERIAALERLEVGDG